LTTTIHNVAPVIAAGGSEALQPAGVLNRNGSFTDPGADQWTATVDYGDGSGVQPLKLQGSRFHLQHRYDRAGPFAVTITLRDDDGGVDRQSFTVTVTPRPQGRPASSAGNAGLDAVFARFLEDSDPHRRR